MVHQLEASSIDSSRFFLGNDGRCGEPRRHRTGMEEENSSLMFDMFNPDTVGMEAIVGSLYKCRNKKSSRSFLVRPSYKPKSCLRSTTSLYEQSSRPSEDSNSDSAPLVDGSCEQPTQQTRQSKLEYSRKALQRRHNAIAATDFSNELSTFRRSRSLSTGCAPQKVNVKSSQRAVSWSSLHSISYIDINKSPVDVNSKLNMEWKDMSFPQLPLSNDRLSPYMKSPYKKGKSLSATHDRSQVDYSQDYHRADSPLKQQDKDEAVQESTRSSSSYPKTRVLYLPFTDPQGIEGEYSGEVNSAIQPHGYGTFTSNDGSTVKSMWKDGMIVKVKGTLDVSNSDRTTHPEDAENDESKNFPTPIAFGTWLPGYHLGLAAKHHSHMQNPQDSAAAVRMAYTLTSFDFAFVLRSNGDWTWSIVADKPFSEDGPSIRFVLDTKGSTKTIKKKYWGKCIRLVNNEHKITAA